MLICYEKPYAVFSIRGRMAGQRGLHMFLPQTESAVCDFSWQNSLVGSAIFVILNMRKRRTNFTCYK